jgi:hypothetical protein
MGRSANFFQALSAGHWADTYQFVHPGVTVMWLGALGYFIADRDYAIEVGDQLDESEYDLGVRPGGEIKRVLVERGVDPLRLLVTLRLVMIVASALVMGLTFAALWRLAGLLVALLATGLMVLDPFTTALSRLLHLDGLSAALMFVALLHALLFLSRRGGRADLVGSGVLAGLAVLTRVSGLVLVPIVGVLVLASSVLHHDDRASVRLAWVAPVIRVLAIWGLALALTCLVLWPALWADPLGTIGRVLFGAKSLASEAHDVQIFFGGRVTRADPGPSFYLTEWLWRTMPATLIGIGLAAVTSVLRQRQVRPSERWLLTGSLLLCISYGLVISVEAKKLDRYLLPSIIPLIVVAAWGWVRTTDNIAAAIRERRGSTWARKFALGALLLPIALQSGVFLSAYPSFRTAYNPLLGGGAAAKKSVTISCDAGYDETAAWLGANAMPEARVLATIDLPLEYMYRGDVRKAPGTFAPPREKDLLTWVQSDFLVVDFGSLQRDLLPSGLGAFLASQRPAKQFSTHGIDCINLYDLRTMPFPDANFGWDSIGTVWGNRLRLASVEAPASIPLGTTVPFKVYLGSLGEDTASSGNTVLVVSAIDASGATVLQTRIPVEPKSHQRSVWGVLEVPGLLRIPPEGKMPKHLIIAFQDRESGHFLPWSRSGQTDVVTGPAVVGKFAYVQEEDRLILRIIEPSRLEHESATPAQQVQSMGDRKKPGFVPVAA